MSSGGLFCGFLFKFQNILLKFSKSPWKLKEKSQHFPCFVIIRVNLPTLPARKLLATAGKNSLSGANTSRNTTIKIRSASEGKSQLSDKAAHLNKP